MARSAEQAETWNEDKEQACAMTKAICAWMDHMGREPSVDTEYPLEEGMALWLDGMRDAKAEHEANN